MSGRSRVPTRGCPRLDGAKADPRDLQARWGLVRRAVSAVLCGGGHGESLFGGVWWAAVRWFGFFFFSLLRDLKLPLWKIS